MPEPAGDVDAVLRRIADKLTAARKHDRHCTRFGAKRHGYHLQRVLPRGEVEQFESRTGARLPEDFRRFVTELGNGGAGPAYGWPAFNPTAIVYLDERWRQPFAGLRTNDADGDPTGCVELHEYGCGMFDLLIINGAERGSIWFSNDLAEVLPVPARDSELSRGGGPAEWRERLLDPLNTSRISFADQYEAWLDEVLAVTPPA